jgi:hypothetical protein
MNSSFPEPENNSGDGVESPAAVLLAIWEEMPAAEQAAVLAWLEAQARASLRPEAKYAQ